MLVLYYGETWELFSMHSISEDLIGKSTLNLPVVIKSSGAHNSLVKVVELKELKKLD